MKFRAAAVVLLCLTFAQSPLLGQETATGSTAGADGSAREPAPLHKEETLARDIDTAGFYELVDWLESLGLPTSGDRDTLARRLLEHYGLQPEADGANEEAGTPLVVDSAARTRYFRLPDVDERYVRLSGGVTLTLRDDENGVVHEIVADEITYNQDLDILSASGNVVYTLDRQGTVERFTGEALTVELDDWQGAFIEGVTQRPRTIDGETVDFSFRGSYITRSSDDIVVMENGRVTSSVAEPPNYEIRAEKIWVLAPGEWGLRSALLYVGRVPVFYFPFFFRPGNKLFFNPAVGNREREGRFVQTTTYLIGQPEEPDSAFSFLQIAEEGNQAGARRIEGLYLVPEESADADASSPQDDESELKLLLDVYSKLGVYAAVDGTFAEAGPFTGVSTYLGLAASRHIRQYSYPGQGTTYSPYFIFDGKPVTSWNQTSIGGVDLPFRFGLGLQASLRGDSGSLEGRLNHFSDSQFRRDFDQRSEQIDWLGLLGQGTPTSEPGLISTFNWSLRGSLNPLGEDPPPWLQRVQLQDVSLTLRWREKAIPVPSSDPDPLVVNREDFVREADSSPEASFFHPDLLQSPSLSAVVSGKLLQISSSRDTTPDDAEPVEVKLRPPWDEPELEVTEDEETLRLPRTAPSLPVPRVPELWNVSLGYSLTPSGVLENTFDAEQWLVPEDVDFGLRYSAASGRVVGSLPLTVKLLANAIALSGDVSATGQYRTVFNRSENVPDDEWLSRQQQALSYSSANATSKFTARFSPFQGSPTWSDSAASYTLNLLLFQLAYQGGAPDASPTHLPVRWVDWNDEFVRGHQLQFSAVADYLGTQRFRVTAELPPRSLRFTGQLDLSYSPVSVSIGSGVFEEEDGSWTAQPLTSQQAVSLGELGQIQNQISYNIEEKEFDYNTTGAKVGPLSGEIELRSTEGFLFGGPGVGWVPDTMQRFQPTRLQLGASFRAQPDPLFRNRLRLAGAVQTGWSMNLLKYTETNFNFGWDAEVEITDFLDLSISSQSTNNQSYVYIGPLADGVNRERKSLAVDLLKSFNVFSRAHREESSFNLQQIRVDATHDLEDWDLIVSYAGRPEIVEFTRYVDPGTGDTVEPGTPGAVKRESREFEWQATLTIELAWRAIRELSSNVRANNQRSSVVNDDESEWDITFGSDS